WQRSPRPRVRDIDGGIVNCVETLDQNLRPTSCLFCGPTTEIALCSLRQSGRHCLRENSWQFVLEFACDTRIHAGKQYGGFFGFAGNKLQRGNMAILRFKCWERGTRIRKARYPGDNQRQIDANLVANGRATCLKNHISGGRHSLPTDELFK